SLVVSGYDDGDVRVWNPATRSDARLPGHNDTSEARYSAQGDHIVSWSRDGSLRLWDVRQRRSRLVTSGGPEVLAAAVDPTGSHVAFALLDGPSFIQAPDGAGKVELPFEAAPTAFEFSPDGTRLVAGLEDGTVQVVRVSNGETVRTEKAPGKIVDATFGPDGKRLAIAGADGTIRVWPAGKAAPVVLFGHERGVNTVAFNRAGDRLVSAGQDGSVRVWNAAGGVSLATVESYDGNAPGAAFSPDGLRVVSADARTRLLRTTPCEVCGPFAAVLQRAHSRPVRTLSVAERERLLAGD
ncbi:MAG: eukaryotic-like serine/threonine-protein kinase, partial [Solirubrobacteraceae bacterium]|nr:eukaryotic-like serine/threonine-protein kinase [Solirubrobacteraceae bacterium]